MLPQSVKLAGQDDVIHRIQDDAKRSLLVGSPRLGQQLMEEALGSGQKLSEVRSASGSSSGWAEVAQSSLRWAAWDPALAKVLEPVVQAGRGYEQEGVARALQDSCSLWGLLLFPEPSDESLGLKDCVLGWH